MAKLSALVAKSMKGLEKAVARGAKRGCLLAAQHLQRKSQAIVPVDTSTLKKSASITDESSDTEAKYRVSYATHYAIYVHENLTAVHNTPPGARAKFLEEPAIAERKFMRKIIETEIAKAIRKETS